MGDSKFCFAVSFLALSVLFLRRVQLQRRALADAERKYLAGRRRERSPFGR